MSHLMTKPTKWLCAQRRLRSAWASTQSDQSSLSTCRKLGSLATHWVYSEDSDQNRQMPRLIWGFTGHIVILLVLSCGGSNALLCFHAYSFNINLVFLLLYWFKINFIKLSDTDHNYFISSSNASSWCILRNHPFLNLYHSDLKIFVSLSICQHLNSFIHEPMKILSTKFIKQILCLVFTKLSNTQTKESIIIFQHIPMFIL